MTSLKLTFFVFFLLISSTTICQTDFYTFSDSTKLKRKLCSKFIKRSVKKIDKTTGRVQKINEEYLLNFNKLERKYFKGLCIINEVGGEQIIKESMHSFNRFENLCVRESDNNSVSFLELDSLQTLSNLIKERKAFESIDNNKGTYKNCGCENFNSIQKSRDSLARELKKGKLMQNYFSERINYYKKITPTSMNLSNELLKLSTIPLYYEAHLKEIKSLFNDKTNFDKKMFSIFFQPVNFVQIKNNKLNSEDSGNTGSPNLPIDEFLKILKDSISKNNLIDSIPNSLLNEYSATSYSDSLISFTKIQSTDSTEFNNITDPDINILKTKRFIDKINLGFNFEARSKRFTLPFAGTIAFQINYQAFRKLCFGSSFVVLTGFDQTRQYGSGELPVLYSFRASGLGTRVFGDYQIKKLFYLTCSYEINRTIFLSNINSFNSNKTAQSILLGLKIKNNSGSNKFIPTIEIMYDLLSIGSRQSQIIFRTGLNFKGKHSY